MLPPHVPRHLGVPLITETDPRILRPESRPRHPHTHPFLNALPQQIHLARHITAHLLIVPHRQIVDRVSVLPPREAVFRKCGGPVPGAAFGCEGATGGLHGWIEAVEMVEEDADVFEAGVHALSVEGHHSVCGVADDDAAGPVVVGLAFDADEWEVGVACVLGFQVFGSDQVGHDAGEVFVEEGEEFGGGLVDEVEVRGGHKEGAGEGFVGAGDGDEH